MEEKDKLLFVMMCSGIQTIDVIIERLPKPDPDMEKTMYGAIEYLGHQKCLNETMLLLLELRKGLVEKAQSQ